MDSKPSGQFDACGSRNRVEGHGIVSPLYHRVMSMAVDVIIVRGFLQHSSRLLHHFSNLIIDPRQLPNTHTHTYTHTHTHSLSLSLSLSPPSPSLSLPLLPPLPSLSLFYQICVINLIKAHSSIHSFTSTASISQLILSNVPSQH